MATKTIKLSQDTIGILKACNGINKSIAIKEGNEIKTLHPDGTIIMEALVQETFPQAFAIYELSRLLGVLSLPAFKDAELIFDDEDTSHMVIQAESSKIKYFFAEEEFVTHPGKSVTLPHVDVEFTLTKEVLDNFEKTASALSHKSMKIKVENNNLYLIATSPDLKTASNDYIVNMGPNDADDFSVSVKLENLKLVPGDFNVKLLKKGDRGISRFEHLTRSIVTFIALDLK